MQMRTKMNKLVPFWKLINANIGDQLFKLYTGLLSLR